MFLYISHSQHLERQGWHKPVNHFCVKVLQKQSLCIEPFIYRQITYFISSLSLCFDDLKRIHETAVVTILILYYALSRTFEGGGGRGATVNIIRHGILLTAGWISHIVPNLQNIGFGTISALALQVIISLTYFWHGKLFMYEYISL